MAKKTKNRMIKNIAIFAIIIVFAFVADIGVLFYTEIVRHDELSSKAEAQQLSDTEIPAMRGTIYDSNGNVLAQSATVYTVYIDPANITDEDERALVVNGLSEIFEYDEEKKAELLEKTKKDSRYEIIEEGVENSVKKKVTQFVSDNLLGMIIGAQQTTKRYYPYASFASSIIGFTGDDNQGLYGVEKYYDEQLTGTNGRIITVKDSTGNKLPTDYETSIEATDGNSIVLTINQTIQYYLEKGLRSTMEEYQCKGAYGVVMNCKTGAVLGMASLPDYDCNSPYKLTYDKVQDNLDKITDKEEHATQESLAIQNQWRNFTVSDTYVPGSVFKTFIASAALEENVVTPETTYTCTGGIQVDTYRMNCHYHEGHGFQNLQQGLENSCNPFFITVGQKLGVHNYFKYFEAFGFTNKTGIDLPGEAAPQFYTEDKYGIVELSSASFGQTNSLTPIQVCTGICAIANGGTLVKPYVVEEIKDAQGNTISKTKPTEVRRVISDETSKTVRGMMQGVVDNGTGKNAYVAGYRVGGKTGTSTKLGEFKEGEERTKYIVSFAAIAPADNPEIAMIIIIDEPNEDLGGGALCAPIAAEIIEQAMGELNVEPRYDDEEQKSLLKSTPNVIGKDINSAKSILSDAGLKVKIVGDGESVIDQNPSSSSLVPNGGSVVLYTEKTSKQTVKVPDFKGASIYEANQLASENNLNIEITGNSLNSAGIVAYRQSVEVGQEVEIGSVITVSFKSTTSVLD